jgi:hypothetical protein
LRCRENSAGFVIVVIGKKIPAVSFADRESKGVNKFYHAAHNSKRNEGVSDLPAAAVSLNENVAMFISYLLKAGRVIYVGTVRRGQSIIYSQGECKMNMPNSIAGWCTILFFLFFGLASLGLAIPSVIIGILALGAAVFTLIGR